MVAVAENRGYEKADPANVLACLHFLARDPKYKHVKPYLIRGAWDSELPFTNIVNVKQPLEVRNLRPLLHTQSPEEWWTKSGFRVLDAPHSLTYEEYNDDEIIRGVHIPEVLRLLQARFKTECIHVLDYRVRKRHPGFPFASGEKYKHQQPSSRVHIDFTLSAIRTIVELYLGKDAPEILDRRWQAVKYGLCVWHPIRGPCVDWPLAVCSISSMDFANDTMAADVCDRSSVIENTQVQYNENQQWYYLKNQMPNELLVFKGADSQAEAGLAAPGVAHASFDNPERRPGDFPRESLEMRFLLIY